MTRFRLFFSRLSGVFAKRRSRDRLDEELHSHFEYLVEENLAKGMTSEDARAAARRALGHTERIREAWRDQRGLPGLESFFQDIRYGLRMLARNPGFTAVMVATLALGIGANAAIFSVVDAVLLHPLPYRNPARLVVVWQKNRNGGGNQFPTPSYLAWEKQKDLFAGFSASTAYSFTLSIGDRPQRIPGDRVTASYFPVLGVRPALGRLFLPEEDVPSGRHVVLLSYGFWQRLGGDPAMLGRDLDLNGAGYTIIGVLPQNFRSPNGDPQLWVPLQLDPAGATSREPGLHWLLVLARLRPGSSLSQSQDRMDSLTPQLAKLYPQTEIQYGAALEPLDDLVVGDVRPALLLLLVAVGLVLAIACVNVTNLLLTRSAAREREMAIRSAMGAHPLRMVRQSVTEGLVLAALGGAAALLLMRACLPILVSLGSLASLPRATDIRLDGRVFAFTALITLAAGLFFSLWPAYEATRFDLTRSLALGAASSGASPRRRRSRDLLVVWEIALATMLLVGAGLLLRSFVALLRAPTGFETSHLVTMKVSVRDPAAPPAKLAIFREQLLSAASEVPGVRSVALARDLPFSGTDPSFPFIVEGRSAPAPSKAPPVRYRLVSPGFFRTMGIPLLAGRDFTSADSATSPCVVVVSQSLAHQSWQSENPVGREIRNGYPGRLACTVVGVVGDVQHWLGVPDEATAYYAYAQLPAPLDSLVYGYITVVARTSIGPASLLAGVRQRVQSAAPDDTLYDVATMDQTVSRATATRSFALRLVGAFAILALLLGIVGIYGVISCAVRERTAEISVRMALGAAPADVARMVVGQGLKLTLFGLAAGLLAALALSRYLSSQLYAVRPDDAATFTSVAILLAAVSLLTSYLPARRATRVDPATVLRSE
jgi:predicted permease